MDFHKFSTLKDVTHNKSVYWRHHAGSPARPRREMAKKFISDTTREIGGKLIASDWLCVHVVLSGRKKAWKKSRRRRIVYRSEDENVNYNFPMRQTEHENAYPHESDSISLWQKTVSEKSERGRRVVCRMAACASDVISVRPPVP